MIVMYMHRIILIWVVTEGLFLGDASGSCPVTPPFASELAELEGFITYRNDSKDDKCAWIVKDHPNKDYILVLSVRSLSMKYLSGNKNECSGYIILPETPQFCDKRNACYIYGQRPQCSQKEISIIVNSVGCVESTWYFQDRINKRISLNPVQNIIKSFTLDYKYMRCSGNANSTNTANNYVAAIVILCALLILSLAAILWIHRRNKYLTSKSEILRGEQRSDANCSPTTYYIDAEATGTSPSNDQDTSMQRHAPPQVTELCYSEILNDSRPQEESQNGSGEAQLTQRPDYVYAVVKK